MSELLTTKQLQELLKVDRITVYRMLNDGRLKGIKIGSQWRFPQSEIDRLFGEERETAKTEEREEAITDFPSDCVQRVQEIFAGVIGIGAVTVSLVGDALTEPTFSNPFCRLMLKNPSGFQACQASWHKIAMHTTGKPPFQICHAGLFYQRSIIHLLDQPAAWLIAGQFYITAPDHVKEYERMQELADTHAIPLSQLTEAARKIPVLNRSQQEKVDEWTPKVANTIESILHERSDLMNRLQRISEISTVQATLSKH